MDSVTLRQSHFKLGDDINKYITSSMEQSDGIENHKQSNSILDQTAKTNYVKVILYSEISNLIIIQHFVVNFIINQVHYQKIR